MRSMGGVERSETVLEQIPERSEAMRCRIRSGMTNEMRCRGKSGMTNEMRCRGKSGMMRYEQYNIFRNRNIPRHPDDRMQM